MIVYDVTSGGASASNAMWAVNLTSMDIPVKLILQGQGNLVWYTADGRAVWGTGGGIEGNRGPYKLTLDNDGYLMITDKDNIVVWSNFYQGQKDGTKSLFQKELPSYILTSTMNKPFIGLRSPNGRYYFGNTDDGKVYIKDGANIIWNSYTTGAAGGYLMFQADGNLVLYAGTGAPWATFTIGANLKMPLKLSMNDDGSLIITDNTGAFVWGTNMVGSCDTIPTFQPISAHTLKTDLTDADITDVKDARFQNWFAQASGIQYLVPNKPSNYISVWPDGGYRSYASCNTLTTTKNYTAPLTRTFEVSTLNKNPPVSPRTGGNAGVCNGSAITKTVKDVLKEKNSTGVIDTDAGITDDANGFSGPKYLGWVNKAANKERILNAQTPGRNATYVSVWNDGGYQSFTDANCTSVITAPQGNTTRTFKIN